MSRNRTPIPCIERQRLNHWTTWEMPDSTYFELKGKKTKTKKQWPQRFPREDSTQGDCHLCVIISSRHPHYWIKFSNTICSDQTPLKESIQFPELPSLKGLMLFYAWDYHFTTHALRKTHYHKIEKSHQPPLPAPAKWKRTSVVPPAPTPPPEQVRRLC